MSFDFLDLVISPEMDRDVLERSLSHGSPELQHIYSKYQIREGIIRM